MLPAIVARLRSGGAPISRAQASRSGKRVRISSCASMAAKGTAAPITMPPSSSARIDESSGML